jgi:hypothetical protein
MARVILHADANSLDAAIYSFDSQERDLQMRLCRIHDGRYRIGLYENTANNGITGKSVWTTERDITRFDIVTLPIPARTSLILKVEQISKADRPAELADLVIDAGDAILENESVTATIHNLGNGAAQDITVGLLDGQKVLQKKIIDHLDAPTDFVAKRTEVVFSNVGPSRNLRIVIDPENKIREILKENNYVKVTSQQQLVK